jgi:riboflavin synthase
MFTGIVQDVGAVMQSGARLVVAARFHAGIGDSIAVNGCCLTHVGGGDLTFDLSEETLSRTALGDLRVGDHVNLESAVRAGQPLGGHFVLGHVDGVGELKSKGEREGGWEYRFAVPRGGEKYLVDKGSITIDGVSLTVVRPAGPMFSVHLIPHTLAATTLGEMEAGARANLEYDVIARYVEGLVRGANH